MSANALQDIESVLQELADASMADLDLTELDRNA
jgi:hypothetical protein